MACCLRCSAGFRFVAGVIAVVCGVLGGLGGLVFSVYCGDFRFFSVGV